MKKLLFFFLFLAYSLLANAQITGTVTDKQKRPVEGAHILLLKSGAHTHAGENGFFELDNVESGDSLRISHIGYKSKIVIVESIRETLSIQLSEDILSLDEIQIRPALDAVNLFAEVNIQTNPVNSSQELLQKVPGLIIGQHAGGGKAEQIFLRGFDIDHGTDINITVDGMPVNMVSHAHGQGYADLHFIIPETIEDLNFGKGPYYANQGNFATAGFVDFRTRKRLEHSIVKLEVGQFNTQRILGMINLLNNEEHSAYIASEYLLSDGPFESPQNFHRTNLIGHYTGKINRSDELSVTASYFTSTWDASGQIPQRAVDEGTITRFGAIDDTEGGKTSRSNLLFNYEKAVTGNTKIKNTAYYSQYDFQLYSNFTFFLNDPVNGDQIMQKENRQLFGLSSELNHELKVGSGSGLFTAGAGFRNDQSTDNELSHTANRITTLEIWQLGDVNETNIFGYIGTNLEFGNWMINPSVRFDRFKFNYYDRLSPTYNNQAVTESILSPKLNILFNHSGDLQLYLKTGKGFHSNDTRVVVAKNGEEILPAAYGADLGFIWKPLSGLLINTAFWHLSLDQEFVYVGDEGIVEPSGKTRRQGFDFSLRHQPVPWLFWDLDATYTIARATEEAEGNNYIPLAPDFTLTGGINIIHPSGVYGGLRIKHIDDRPANEDNSIIAKGYSILDLTAGYEWKNIDLGFTIQNLLDEEWNETQFATESRLSHETEPVEEIHFIPGTPLFFKASLTYKF